MKSLPNIHAGIDDATKCPCIGSVFIAGVVADKKTIARWDKIGVKDSKLLTKKERDRLEKEIKKTARAYTVRHIPPQEIDDKTFNLNTWEMIALLKILRTLHSKSPFTHALIDNWEVTDRLFHVRWQRLVSRAWAQRLADKKITLPKRLPVKMRLIPEHQADTNYTVVGAASILARAGSDRQYDRYRKQYGDFGSGNPGDPKARYFMWRHRHNPLPIIRTSWQTFARIAELDDIMDDSRYAPYYRRLRRRP